MSRNCPAHDLSPTGPSWDNCHMEQMIETLKQIGLPADEITRIKSCYDGDLDGLRDYVRYMRAILDDRHEYVD